MDFKHYLTPAQPRYSWFKKMLANKQNTRSMATMYWAFALGALFLPTTVYGNPIADLFDTVFDYLAWGFLGIGVMVAIFGAAWLGITIANDNSADRNKCILAIIGGAITAASGGLFLLIGGLIGSPPGL